MGKNKQVNTSVNICTSLQANGKQDMTDRMRRTYPRTLSGLKSPRRKTEDKYIADFHGNR